jgi:hypothetical protein
VGLNDRWSNGLRLWAVPTLLANQSINYMDVERDSYGKLN